MIGKKRRLLVISVILVLLLLGGGVYAAIQNAIDINGTLSFGSMTKLEFTGCSFYELGDGTAKGSAIVAAEGSSLEKSSDGSVEVSYDINSAGDTLTINVKCNDTNSSDLSGVHIDVAVKNNSTEKAKVTALTPTIDTAISGYIMNGIATPYLSQITGTSGEFDAGDEKTFSLKIQLDETDLKARLADSTKSFSFTYTIDYSTDLS